MTETQKTHDLVPVSPASSRSLTAAEFHQLAALNWETDYDSRGS